MLNSLRFSFWLVGVTFVTFLIRKFVKFRASVPIHKTSVSPARLDPIPGCHPIPPPPPEIIDGEEEWIVEGILDSKVINRKLRYLVKWEGFGIDHNSWKPWDSVHAPAH